MLRESYAPWIVWCLTTALALAILGLIVGAPMAKAHGDPAFASATYEAFSLFCHQISERSFHVDGNQFAVCSRCTGLYAGFAFAALAYPLARSVKWADMPPLIWLLVAAIPMGIDFMLGHFEIWPNTHLSRFSSGALLGAVAGFYVMPGLIALSTVLPMPKHKERA